MVKHINQILDSVVEKMKCKSLVDNGDWHIVENEERGQYDMTHYPTRTMSQVTMRKDSFQVDVVYIESGEKCEVPNIEVEHQVMAQNVFENLPIKRRL